ncbi:MAG TPA: Sua5/YciO/YrdC/YwlC family protein [Acidimicrobiales bacterium]|nr:Sua5/YciO/YrdC/YwlC family protein [Acidimicrobiales bacterium]
MKRDVMVDRDVPTAGEGKSQENEPDALLGPPTVEPPVIASAGAEAAGALDGGAVIAVPGVGGYCLAVRTGSHEREERLADLAADPEGPHYAVGHRDDVRSLTSAWNDELNQLLERCWPGPVEVFLPRTAEGAPYDVEADSGAWAVTVGMPDGRAMRKLCREHGPWRTVPLRLTQAHEVAHAFSAADVACIIDGGPREGEPPTVVDATVTPVRVLREGALPANFIDATMAMGARKRRWFRSSPTSF